MTLRYHLRLGVPEGLELPLPGDVLSYAVHAYHAAAQDRAERVLPVRLPPYELVEVEVESVTGRAFKWVVRSPMDRDRDLVFVLTRVAGAAGYFVKTVWVNRRDDIHATMDVSRYDRPELVTN